MSDRGIETRIIREIGFFPAYDGLRVTAQSGDVLYRTDRYGSDTTIDQGDFEDFEQGVYLNAAAEGGVSVVLDYVTLDDRVDEGGGGGGGPVAAEDVSVAGIDGITDQQGYDEGVLGLALNATETAAGAIPATTFINKGELLLGTGSGTYTAVSPGTDGQVLVADSASTGGVKWDDPA